MKAWVKVEFVPNDQVLGEEGYFNQLSYNVADVDGDGRTEASAAETVLHVQATVRNLGRSVADNVRLRLLADSIPGSISYTRETLKTDFERLSAWGLEEIVRSGTRIKGVAMGADVVVP